METSGGHDFCAASLNTLFDTCLWQVVRDGCSAWLVDVKVQLKDGPLQDVNDIVMTKGLACCIFRQFCVSSDTFGYRYKISVSQKLKFLSFRSVFTFMCCILLF